MNRLRWQAVAGFALLGMAFAVSAPAQTLKLEEALRIAEKNAPLARIAEAQADEGSARAHMAAAAFFPQIGVNSNYVSSDNPVQVFMFALNQGKFSLGSDVNNPPRADNWQLSAQAGLRLFSGGSDLANYRAARSAASGLKHMASGVQNDLTLKVIKAYLSVLTAQEFAHAAESAVNAYRTAEQVFSARLDAGTVLKTDLLNIQVQRFRSDEQLLNATNALQLAKENLKFILGLESLPYDDFSSIDDLELPGTDAIEPTPRPEVEAKRSFARSVRSQLSATKGSYLPALNFFASIDRYQGWEFDGTKHNWTIGLSAHWFLFDGFLVRSQVREKRAALVVAEEEARMAQLQASLELTSARFSLQESDQRVTVLTAAKKLALESAALTRQRSEQGLMLTSQVIDAENALVQAEVGLVQAKADRLLAIASLRRALGLPIVGDL